MAGIKRSLVDRLSSDQGVISRRKNTQRAFVPANMFAPAAVTGTWALEVASNVTTLATDDAGTTNRFQIPFLVGFSDASIERVPARQRTTVHDEDHVESGPVQGATDRGVRILGLEVIYTVAASALTSFDLDIYKVEFDAEGAPTATEITTTLVPDTEGDDGTEVDEHRMAAVIGGDGSEFLDSGNIVVGFAEFEDGTASDVNIFGAIWHYAVLEE